MDPLTVFVLAAVGNLLPVPLLLLSLGPVTRAAANIKPLKKLLDKIFERARSQGAAWKENEFWALALFVGVPLPGTGAWSGAIGAFVLGMGFWDAVAANFMGILIAGALMVTLTLMGWTGLLVGGAILLGAPALALLMKARKSSA
jgi:uncharacterized membrane protein